VEPALGGTMMRVLPARWKRCRGGTSAWWQHGPAVSAVAQHGPADSTGVSAVERHDGAASAAWVKHWGAVSAVATWTLGQPIPQCSTQVLQEGSGNTRELLALWRR
jgi:hypothetical protein